MQPTGSTAAAATLPAASSKSFRKTGVEFAEEGVPTRRPSVRRPVAIRKLRRVLHRYHEWRSGHQYLGRYSVEKLLAFEDYCNSSSALRVAAVLLLTPLPGLIVILLIATIPLNSPLDGVSGNATFFVHSALSYTLMSIGLLLFIRCALGWPNTWYSHKQMLIIALLVSVCNEFVFIAIGSAWRFPVPFRDLLGIPSYFVLLGVFHVMIVGKTLFIKSQSQLIAYVPLLMVQSSTLFIFQAYAIAFEHVSTKGQVVLTICFPLLKVLIKRMAWHFSTCLPDVATDVTVCVAEIFGSLFLNVCIQNVRSPAIGVIIIVIDITQAFVETRMYLSHKFIVDGRRAISTAVKIVEGALFPGVIRAATDSSVNRRNSNEFNALVQKGTSIRLDQTDDHPKTLARTRSRSFNKVAISTMAVDLGPASSSAVINRCAASNHSTDEAETARRTSLMQAIDRRGSITVDDIAINHKEHAKLLTQTLQLLFAAEVLVFAEYMEAATSVSYALYLLGLYGQPYAKYNLSFIGLTSQSFNSSLVAVAVYIVLEILSLGMLVLMVSHKYGFSVLYQLAFALEKYWMSVQGKFAGSLSLIFILNTVHHGKVCLLIPCACSGWALSVASSLM